MSIHEKQLLHPEYCAGDDPRYEPFFKVLHPSTTFYNFMQYSALLAGIFVICRFVYNFFLKVI